MIKQLMKQIKEFNGLSFECDYDLSLNGETLPIIIETNLQVIHHNRGHDPFQTTYKTTYKDGDRWKIGYYYNNAPGLESLIDSQIISEHGNILLFTKEELLGILEYLEHKGVTIKETD